MDITRLQKLEAILAREVIDLARERADDKSSLESLSEICFTISQIIEELPSGAPTTVEWKELFDILDGAYAGDGKLSNEDKARIDTIYMRISASISEN